MEVSRRMRGLTVRCKCGDTVLAELTEFLVHVMLKHPDDAPHLERFIERIGKEIKGLSHEESLRVIERIAQEEKVGGMVNQ